MAGCRRQGEAVRSTVTTDGGRSTRARAARKGTGVRVSDWQKVGIEVPPHWQEKVRACAEKAGSPMRYLWVAAIDLLLTQTPEEIERRCLAIELMARKDFERLNEAGPGATRAVLADVASNLASAKKTETKRKKKVAKKH